MNRRLVPLALAASLAGNLFLGGMILGAKLRGGPEEQRGPPPRSARLADVAERLDPAEAEALRALLREQSEKAEPRLAAIRAARREVDAVMAQPEYDPAAAGQALARVRAEEAALRGEVDLALIRFAQRLDPEERAAMAPLLRKARRLRGGGPRPERSEPPTS